MSVSVGSTSARASSGSSSSINSIEPLISANSAVTVLRSAAIAVAASGCSGVTRISDAESVDGVAPSETALSMSEAPHLPQKLEEGGLSALHFAHDLLSAFPHCAQKLLPSVLFVPHFVQCTGVLPNRPTGPFVSPSVAWRPAGLRDDRMNGADRTAPCWLSTQSLGHACRTWHSRVAPRFPVKVRQSRHAVRQ